VVVVSTSGGLKDFDVALPEPVALDPIEATPEGMARALEERYGYRIGQHTEVVL
jgi:hypothetical protein